jgi:hypothetical protein
MTLIRLGAVASAVVSLGLLVVVLVRDVGLNALNGWTIAVGIVASVLALLAPSRPVFVLAALVLAVLAMLPALIGGLGLLYLLPIGMMIGGLTQQESQIAGRSR